MKLPLILSLWFFLPNLVLSINNLEEFMEQFVENYSEITEAEKAIEAIRPKLDDIAERGFMMAEEIRRQNIRLSTRKVSFHHQYRRTSSSTLDEDMSCFNEGMRVTRELIMKELDLTNGQSLTQEEVLGRLGSLPSATCHRLATKCNVANHIQRQSIACIPDAPYRTYTGQCNNEHYPEFGQAGSTFVRGVKTAKYGPNNALVEGLPNPRVVCNIMSQKEAGANAAIEPGITLMLMQWGQFLDHDITLTEETHGVPACCENFQKTGISHPDCIDIDIPADDPYYMEYNVNCLPLVRSACGGPSCNLPTVQREQMSSSTSFIDCSHIYGNSEADVADLRLTGTPYMKTSANTEVKDASCSIEDKYLHHLPPTYGDPDDGVFRAGDGRVNEQLGLTSLHIVFMRLHDIFADLISNRFPSLNADEVFEEARKRVIACMQHITYAEFLPAVLGKPQMKQFTLDTNMLPQEHFIPLNIDPTLMNEFSAAIFRFGHTLIADFMGVFLADSFFASNAMMNLTTTPTKILAAESELSSMKVDTIFEDSILNKLFRLFSQEFGSDLCSRNIQRGRDHGLPSLNDYRAALKMHILTSENIKSIIRDSHIEKLQEAYPNLDDVDLFIGGLAEKPIRKGSLLGPTSSSIMIYQFYKLKYGDHFFYLKDIEEDELLALKHTSLADVLCETTCIDKIQRMPMEVNSKKNPVKSCAQHKKYEFTIFDYWKQ